MRRHMMAAHRLVGQNGDGFIGWGYVEQGHGRR